jgi:hypothetical protein
MSHTKGPWVFNDSSRFLEIIGSDGRNILSSIYADDRSMDDFNDSTDRSNAKLIAAAPDMLKVLEGLYVEMLGQGQNVDAVSLRAVETVIKKAKGT